MAKHIPERMCVGCRALRPKRELVRIVRDAVGNFAPDDTGKKPGRGAYICRDPACLAKAQKNRALERSFKCNVDRRLYEKLKMLFATTEAT